MRYRCNHCCYDLFTSEARPHCGACRRPMVLKAPLLEIPYDSGEPVDLLRVQWGAHFGRRGAA